MKYLSLVAVALLCTANAILSAQTFTISTSPRSQTIMPGQGGKYHVEIVPKGGYMATVNMNVFFPTLGNGAIFTTPNKLNYPYAGGADFTVYPSATQVGTHLAVVHGWNGPLHVFDTVYFTVSEVRSFVGWSRYDTGNSLIPDNVVRSLALDRNDNVWLGTALGRVAKFDRANWTVHRFITTDTIRKGHGDSIVFPIDTIITHEVGRSVNVVTVDSNNDVWIATDKEVRKFNGDWNIIKSTGNELTGGSTAIAVAPDQTIWFAVWGQGVTRFNSSGWTQLNTQNSGIPYTSISKLTILRNGNPVIGSSDGNLGVYDGSFWSNFQPSELELSYAIGAIMVDRQGFLWIASGNGVVKSNGSDRQFYKFPKIIPTVTSIDLDSKGNLWIGTTGGLVRYDFTTITLFNVETSGIPSNDIRAVKVDRNDVVWVATNNGLGVYDERVASVVVDEPARSGSNAGILAFISPHPVTGPATIRLLAPVRTHSRVSLVNSLGREVAVMLDGTIAPGETLVPFNNDGLPAGTYFLRLAYGGMVEVEPVVVVR